MNNSALPHVAYFCMEYGLDCELQIYAGGLGILAGDYLKAAYDRQAPITGLGILWRKDYTEQYIGEDGYPYDIFPTFDFDFLKDTGITVTIPIRNSNVTCKVWLVDKYSNAPLYLLDADYPGSSNSWMTEKLYSNSEQNRIAAEMILGIGGIKVLRALNIKPDVYHLNEGHAIFAAFELIREKVSSGLSFEQAWYETRNQVVFTTHTPVEAGNEIHNHQLLQHMQAYDGLTYEQARQIGGEPFNMTLAALRISYLTNGVSRLHGQTTRKIWSKYDNIPPIISITNGVHCDTWQDKQIRKAFETGTDLWEPHQKAKKRLINYVQKTTVDKLDPDVLLIGFARRAAPYKRSDLIFRNAKLLEPLLQQKKLQIIFSGKAHPDDHYGKAIIRDLAMMDKKYKSSIVFLENYNMKIAHLMVQGCDVWLNNPRRPMEASGTSGMKAAMNGVINLSVADGWVSEGLQHGINGWLLDHYHVFHEQARNWDQDEQDLSALYQVLLEEVIPTYYYNREKWLSLMKSSIDMSRWQFSSVRMLIEYFDLLYKKAEQHKKNSGNKIFDKSFI